MSDPEHTKPLTQDTPHLPREIGGYAVQRVLGSGGMATVYAALQKRPRRTVAVKVMQGATNPNTALRRFRREIEILGKLRHPYIAQVFEAGVHETEGGDVPFFVMEYVPSAKTIIEFAEQKQLDIRQRIKLFIKVCAAVEHGHQRKIIHRDLKPGNILIDENGDPKIIDFGVARAVEIDLAHQTLHTEVGRLVGTVQYMAPEQLDKTPIDLDARCDVYSLGVVLYKLLTDLPPHDLKGLPLFTAAQVIREDAPPRPSSIRPELKGDLETIILKALSKDRARRYRDAGQLGRDLLRYLTSKPIQARRAGMRYRARLFIARHRVEVTAASVVVLVVAVAAGIILAQNLRTADAETAPTNQDDPAPTAVTSDHTGAESSRSDSSSSATSRRTGFTLTGLRTPVYSIAFDSSNHLAAVAAEGARIWSIEDGAVTFAATPFEGRGIYIGMDDTSSRALLVSEFGETGFFNVQTGAQIGTTFPACNGAFDAAIDRAGERASVCCSDLSLRIGNAEGEELRTLRGTRGAFLCSAFSPSGSRLVGGSERGGVYLWDMETGRLIEQLDGLTDDVMAIAFLEGDDRIAAVSESGHGMIWSLGEEVQHVALHVGLSPVPRARFDVSGRWVVAASESGELAAVDLRESLPARVTIPVSFDAPPPSIAISADGQWCAFGLESGIVRAVRIRWSGSDASDNSTTEESDDES